MKRLAIVALLAAVTGSAYAEYRIWFTPAPRDNSIGLTKGFHPDGTPWLIDNPSQAITSDDHPNPPNYTNNLDVYAGHYAVVNFPVYDAGASNWADAGTGTWVYIWGQFYGEPLGSFVHDATFEVFRNFVPAQPSEVSVVWYKVDDMGGFNMKRWDGSSTEADNYATFRQVSQSLAAVSGWAYGLFNVGGTAANWNLYSGGPQDGLGGRIHLLGAIQFHVGSYPLPGPTTCFTIQIPTDPSGDPLFWLNDTPTWPVVGSVYVWNTGACCTDLGCHQTTEAQCPRWGWRGWGTSCDLASCDGACCHADGSCTQDEGWLCSGQWLGPGSSCNPNPCVPAVCPGDSNCDAVISWPDIDYFVAAMNDNLAAWEAMFAPGAPVCSFDNNDANSDGIVNWRDIDPFVALMNTTCP